MFVGVDLDEAEAAENAGRASPPDSSYAIAEGLTVPREARLWPVHDSNPCSQGDRSQTGQWRVYEEASQLPLRELVSRRDGDFARPPDLRFRLIICGPTADQRAIVPAQVRVLRAGVSGPHGDRSEFTRVVHHIGADWTARPNGDRAFSR
jgi:hypothetical protein